jgi:hypothetical protein
MMPTRVKLAPISTARFGMNIKDIIMDVFVRN